MTMKQYQAEQFLVSLSNYRRARAALVVSPYDSHARMMFIRASVTVHAYKGLVPRRLQRLIHQ